MCDRIGPKNTMLLGLIFQSIFGFALAGAFGSLKNNFPGLIILYSCYTAAGEFGAGNNLGLLASKAVAPSAVRGTFYGACRPLTSSNREKSVFTSTELLSSVLSIRNCIRCWQDGRIHRNICLY